MEAEIRKSGRWGLTTILDRWYVAALAFAPMLAWDISARRVPNPLVLLLFGASVAGMLAGWWAWSPWGLLAGLTYPMLAGFPGGDIKAMGILGGLLGVQAISAVFAISGVVTLTIWKLRWPSGPWLAYVAMAAGMAWFAGRFF